MGNSFQIFFYTASGRNAFLTDSFLNSSYTCFVAFRGMVDEVSTLVVILVLLLGITCGMNFYILCHIVINDYISNYIILYLIPNMISRMCAVLTL